MVTRTRKLARLLIAAIQSVIACSLLCLTGCLSLPSSCSNLMPAWAGSPNQATTLMSYWDNRIRFAPDTLNNGTPIPGLAGRLLLVNEEQTPAKWVDADGVVIVDLYDMTGPAGSQPRMIERWQFDTRTLKQMKRRDAVGDGYTLFLPWTSFRPEITQVKLQLSYTPTNGMAVYADPALVSLRADESVPVHNRTVMPAQYQSPAKKY